MGKARTSSAALRVPLEAPLLLALGGELLKAVRELDAGGIQLEAQGDARVGRIEFGERGLRCRVAVHEGQPALAERRSDSGSHQEIEELVPVALRDTARIEPRLERGVGEGGQGRLERIDSRALQERVAVSQTLDGAGRSPGAEELGDERADLVDQRLERETEAVPFHQREFGVVQAAALMAAEDVADLVDVPGPGCEQPFHGVFGRRVEEAHPTVIAREHDLGRMDIEVGDGRVDDMRRLDLEDAALREKRAGGREQPRAQLQPLAGRGRPP